jgi:hypothetical protein
MRYLRGIRPSPATIIASLALLVALAGTGYAAITLPANSVGARQLQNNAVTTSKVKNHSLLGIDFATGQVPRGPRGFTGPPGPPGAAGARGPTGPAGPSGTAASRWALVRPDGVVVASSTPAPVVVQSSPGQYYLNWGSAVTGHALVVSAAYRDADTGFRGTVVAAICGNTGSSTSDTITCASNNNTSTVYVTTSSSNNLAYTSHAFYIAIL